VDDGGEGDEDRTAVLEDGNVHAGDLGIDEMAVAGAFVAPDLMVIAIVFAAHGGRSAAVAGGSVIVVALLVATWIWNWCWHGRTLPWVSNLCMIFQTNHLPIHRIRKRLKTNEMICKILKTLELRFLRR
jgi:hypothetical protein